MAKEKTKESLLARPLPDPPKRLSDKSYKPKKPKLDWKAKLYGCPFCGVELPEVTHRSEIQEWVKTKNPGIMRLMKWYEFPRRAKKCPNCKSREMRKGCPACKHTTWYDPRTKIYKHRINGCGFFGEKK